jgi:acetyl-CoA synthetase
MLACARIGAIHSVVFGGFSPESLADRINKAHVVEKIGAIARPEEIILSSDVPKIHSGKIMRRLLRDIAEGRALGDTTTLADSSVVEALREEYEEKYGG